MRSNESNSIEECFTLTFHGWLSSRIGVNESKALLENLYEWMENADTNAIVFEDFSGSFEKVEYNKEWDEEDNEDS